MPDLRTLILVAFPPEWDAMVPHVLARETLRINGRSVVTGDFAGKPVLFAQTGVSMVNAAMTTQLLIDRFAVSRVVVSGIAGGLDPMHPVGRTIASTRWGQFLEVGMGRPSGSGYRLPPLPGETDLPSFGMMMPRDAIVGNAVEPEIARRWIAADPALLDVARSLVGLDLIVGGSGLSGSAFVNNAAYREYLFATFGASVLDMESAAIAQVAFANSVPFIAFRALSDLAGGEADGNNLPAWMARAAANVAAVTRAFVAALPD